MHLIRNISEYQKGNRVIFEHIYMDLEKILKGIKIKFRDEEIYDVVLCSIHEILLKIKIEEFSDEKYIINYIKRALVNRALDEIRVNKRDRNLVNFNSEILEINSNNLRNSLSLDSSIEFYDLLKRLNDREKMIIERYFRYQESIAEIAKDIGLSRQFVNKIKNNALTKLRKYTLGGD